VAALAVALAQVSLSSGPEGSAAWWTSAAGIALWIAGAICLPFLIWPRTRRWILVAFPVLCALLFVAQMATEALPWLLAFVGLLVPPVLLLLWRRTRRVGLVLLGATAIGWLALANYWAQVICTIGYMLLLLALWPRWRLLQAAPRGREMRPVIPSRGVLRVRSWPACRRSETEGFSLITSLVGIGFVLIAAAVATQAISTTMAAVRRADHLAVATDLLESARERSLLGRDTADLQARAARLLPKGTAILARTDAEAGLTRVSALATWEEANGRPGQVTLEWLTAKGSR